MTTSFPLGRVGRIVRFVTVVAVIAGVGYAVRFAPVQVHRHQVERGTVVAEVFGTGTLEARYEATVSPKIPGRIAKVLVDQGDRVTAGTVLVRLDDEELRQQVAIAQANVDAAVAAIERLSTDKAREVAVYEQARTSDERSQRLLSQKAVSREEVDKTREALAVAMAGVARAEAAIAEGQKELVAAEKTLDYHRARLRDTEIAAPFGGLIVKRHRESGDVVVPGSSILTLVATDELWIRAWVDETEMARLAPELPARVVFRSEPERSFPGNVARLGKETDRETREFVVDVRVVELPENWAVGQRAEAFVEVARKSDAVVLPARLLSVREGTAGVFVEDAGIAVWKTVMPGLRGHEHVEIVDGLLPGEVVVEPVVRGSVLYPGTRVVSP